MKIFDYFKLKKDFNKLNLNYKILQEELETKSRDNVNLVRQNRLLKKELKECNKQIKNLTYQASCGLKEWLVWNKEY